MKKPLLLLLMVIVAWKLYKKADYVSLGPGVMASEIPLQQSLSPPLSLQHDGFTVNKVATFRIKAKVLSKENYRFDRGAEISPTDLTLGWGNMSDESVLDKIEISQSGRFYYWRVESFPISHQEIVSSSANMHLIPADASAKHSIDQIRKGDIVEISGSLVNIVSNNEGWYWNSSLTRSDSGAGACELIWVDDVYIVTP